MDPVSLTAGICSITANCLTTAAKLSSLYGKYQKADQTILGIQSETKLVGIYLNEIQNLLLKKPYALAEAIYSVLDDALIGCGHVYSVLDTEVQKIRPGSVRGRLALLWNEEVMSSMLEQIRRQHSGLNFLITLMNMHNLDDINRHLRKNASVVRKISDSRMNLDKLYPGVEVPASVLDLSKETSRGSTSLVSTEEPSDQVTASTFEIPPWLQDPINQLAEQQRENKVLSEELVKNLGQFCSSTTGSLDKLQQEFSALQDSIQEVSGPDSWSWGKGSVQATLENTEEANRTLSRLKTDISNLSGSDSLPWEKGTVQATLEYTEETNRTLFRLENNITSLQMDFKELKSSVAHIMTLLGALDCYPVLQRYHQDYSRGSIL